MEWDVKIGDPIEYFDPTLSYEITKYRPIDGTHGLDFNPDWFREDAMGKLRTGKYSNFTVGTKSHYDWWRERLRRCDEGYEVNGYRLTGDNYFWLNYYRLKTSVKGKKAGAGRKMDFPAFLVFQYEYFHYVEICEMLGKDVGLLKARALGFSEMGACLCVRPYITTPNYRVVASAPSEKHLKPLLSKIWLQLDFLNTETETAFKRIRMVINTATYKRASKKTTDGDEAGHMSEIEGLVVDSPEKMRGDRTERLFMEESGSNKVFTKSYLQANALITVLGGDRIGTRFAWGTGGDSGSAIEGIKDMTLKPDVYNVLKFKHNYTPDGRYVYTAMFIPATRNVARFTDERGWCDPVKAREYYDAERLTMAEDPKALLIFKAEYCYTIEEALIQQGDNMFPREELAEQEAHLTIYKDIELPKQGYLTWKLDQDSRKNGVWWKQSDEGKILILEHPEISEDGTEYKNLYVGGIDSIDIGQKDTATTTDKVSDFCIVIKKRILGMKEPKYVAMYKDRPKDIREAYENAAKLLTYYGCQAVLESTRTAILTYFRDKSYMQLLMKRPRSTMPDVSKGNSNMYGTPATEKVINHYRELIYDFCLDYSQTIAFIEIVRQLLNYSNEKKKEFDIVAAMGMCEIGDEEMSVKKPEPRDKPGKQFKHVGWYKDNKGYRHWGEIPTSEEEKYERTRISAEDSWLYNDLV